MKRDYWLALFVLCAALLWLTACRSCPTCPKPIAPPPVVTVVHPPPCHLPELPAPLLQIGIPDPAKGGYFVPQASWALLGGYQAEIRAWIVAAAGCLTTGQP